MNRPLFNPKEGYELIRDNLGFTDQELKEETGDWLELINSEYDPDDNTEFVKRFYSLIDSLNRENLKRYNIGNDPLMPACGKVSCKSQCCYDFIQCTPPEAMAIAEYIMENNITYNNFKLEQFRNMTREEFVNLSFNKARCPFLKADYQCAIYPMRPSVCRSHYATDDSDCNNDVIKMIPSNLTFTLSCAMITKFGGKSMFKQVYELLSRKEK